MPGFLKADAQNLPRVDMVMVLDFFNRSSCYIQPGCQHSKLERSKGENYSSDAVGYVQLKRDGATCAIHARVTPETRINSKAYAVQVSIDETEERIIRASCLDCVAAAGGCKHVAAVLGWLNGKSSAVSVTSTESYWKKARLSCVPAELKTADAAALRPKRRRLNAQTTTGKAFLAEVLEAGSSRKCTGMIFDHFGDRGDRRCARELGLDQLLQTFVTGNDDANGCEHRVESSSATSFMTFCSARMTSALCSRVEAETKSQSDDFLWHAMRFGRVTASNAYSAAHCETTDGTLVSNIIGASRLRDTAAMLRGRKLEPLVIAEVESELGVHVRASGLVLSPEYPVLGASPDGLTTDGSIVEVKCPVTEKNFKKYILASGDVAAKYRAQLQMLMTLTGAERAFFCVAHPDFEKSRRVRIVELRTNGDYSKELCAKCVKFWEKAIFPKLIKAYTDV